MCNVVSGVYHDAAKCVLLYVQVHKLMLQDTARIQAYKNAIFSCAEYFKDRVVMDVGAGTGKFKVWPGL